MTNRQIGLHLGILFALIAGGITVYRYFHGPSAVPHLIDALKDEDWQNRQQTIAQLGKLGPPAKAAVPKLLTLAGRDSRLSDQMAAAAALVEIDPSSARTIIPQYVAALQSHDARMRYEAGMVLSALGAVGKSAVPALLQAARDPDGLVRRWAVTALGRIGIPSTQVLPTLITALDDKDSTARHDALIALSYGGFPRDGLRPAEPALRRLLDDRMARFMAEPILKRLETTDSTESTVSAHMLASSREQKVYALHKLAKAGPTAAAASSAIMRQLNDEHPLVRYLAVEALGATGAADAQIIVALEAKLNDTDDLVRFAAAEALEALRAGHPTLPVTSSDKEGG